MSLVRGPGNILWRPPLGRATRHSGVQQAAAVRSPPRRPAKSKAKQQGRRPQRSRKLGPREAARAVFLLGRVKDRRSRRTEVEEAIAELRKSRLLVGLKDYTAVLSGLGKRGWVDLAMEIFEEMRSSGSPPNVITYSTMISGCDRGKQWTTALDLLKQMEQEEIKPNVITCNAAITVCGKGSKWELALTFFDELQEQGLDPTEVTYGAAISACRRGSKWQLSLRLKDDMLARGMRGNLVIWYGIIRTCVACRKPDVAIQMFGEMKRVGFQPDQPTYNALLRACEQSGWWKRALQLLQKMKSDGFDPDVATYSTVISALAQGWESDRAASLFEKLREKNIVPTALGYAGAMVAYQRIGRPQTTLDLLQDVEQRGLETSMAMYIAAMKACEDLEHWDGMLGHFDDMQARRLNADARTYNAAIGACALAGQQSRATELLEEMIRRHLEPSGRSHLAALRSGGAGPAEPARAAAACARDGLLDDALRLLAEADPAPADAEWHGAVAAACASAGRLADAASVLRGLGRRGLDPGRSARATLVEAYSRSTAWSQALALLEPASDSLDDGGLGAEAYAATIRACTAQEGNHWAEALWVLAAMRQHALKPGAADYETVIGVIAKNAQWNQASALLVEMESLLLEPSDKARLACFPASEESQAFRDTLEAFDEMVHNDLLPDMAAYRAAMDACDALGQRQRGRELRAQYREELLAGSFDSGQASKPKRRHAAPRLGRPDRRTEPKPRRGEYEYSERPVEGGDESGDDHYSPPVTYF